MNGGACLACLRRSWLLARLSAHLDEHRFDGRALARILALEDLELIHEIAADEERELRDRYDSFDVAWISSPADTAQVCLHDESYPPMLKAIAGPPAVLNVAGRHEVLRAAGQRPCVALVGSRGATPEAHADTTELAKRLASAGILIISGLALGIDGAAHLGAIDAGHPTLSVLPCAVDVAYPARAGATRDAVLAHGCLISELPGGVRPRPWTFPGRNRIIAGLASVLVVVEAAERSGALSAARLANSFGRSVGAMPRPIEASNSSGTFALLAKDQAAPVADADDVLQLLHTGQVLLRDWEVKDQTTPTTTQQPAPPHLEPLLARIASGCDTIAALDDAGLDMDDILRGAAELEVLGLVVRTSSGRYLPA